MKINKIIMVLLYGFLGLFIGCATSVEQKTVKEEIPNVKQSTSIPTPQPQSEVERLIQQLGSDDWQTRETATQGLIKTGDSILPQLENAYNSTKDPEIRKRLITIADEYGYIFDPLLRKQVTQWLEQLYSPDGKKRGKAFDNLINSGKGAVKNLKRIMELPLQLEITAIPDKATCVVSEHIPVKICIKNKGDNPCFMCQPDWYHKSKEYSGNKISYWDNNRLNGTLRGIGHEGSSPRTSDFLKTGMLLAKNDSATVNTNYFAGRLPGVYSSNITMSTDKVTSLKKHRATYQDIAITLESFLDNFSYSITICVLPAEEDRGKRMRITPVKPEYPVNEPVEIECLFAEEVKCSADNGLLAFWYLLLDDKMALADYGRLNKDKTEELPAVYKKDQKVKVSFKKELKPGDYRLLVGYGDRIFSQLEKIKILPAK